MTIIFLVTTIIFAIGWLRYKAVAVAYYCYIETKGYTHPSDDEVAKYVLAALRHMFKIK